MKNKLKQAISILLIELIILLPIAIADSLTISNVRVEDITESSANVKWETDKPAEGGVNFGKDTSLGEEELKAGYAITEHSVPLTNLEDDTKYYFEVKANYGTEEFKDDNSGNLYDFTTLPKKELFVEASVPEHYNGGHKIDITGESIKGAEINIYANGEAAGMLAAGSDGRFVFYDVALKEEENTIKLTAESGGKKVEKSYKINVDTAEPVVEIEEIPDIVGEEKITIKGKVNEKANISFYVKKEGDATPPGKVMNLAATSVEANRIELSWNKTEAEDFEAYIIYRDNKAIALIPDIGYTDYSDVMVNSDREYAYEAAVIDLGGNIGERSDTLTVNSLEGGLEDRKEPAEVDIAKEVSGLQKTITAEAEFEEEIEIGKEDGFYRMRIVAADPAGNEWIYERAGNDALLLDTKDPEIEIIYPKSDASIYESYADSVTIRGKTEPGARVYLYVSRSPLEGLEEGEEAGITTLVEADLRTDENCRLNIGDEEQCRKRADYEAVADAEGYFEFEDVDLTSILGGGLRMREYETGEDSPDLAEEDDQKDENTVESRLMFIAVDAAGRKGTAEISYNVATCWSTDLTWDVTPLPEYQSPTFLNVERLKEGTEEIYFYFNFTYHGVGKNTINTRVTRLSVNDACGSGYLENRERYEYSCDILGSCTSKLSPNGRTAYVACSLNSLEGVENWAEDDWDGFIEAVKEEMTFPFKLTIEYDEEQDDGKIDSKTHYLCTEIGYIVDAARIDPRDVLPDWLLYDAVDFLESSIENIDGWLDKIGEILQWTAFGCMVSFLTKFVVGIYRRVVCHYDSFSRRAAKALGSMEGGAEQEEKCKTCLREYEGGENGEAMKRYNANKDFQDIISDTCLKECYPQCDSAWSKEEALYKTYRWACDRVFGHAAPSKWTETASDDELFQKVTAGTGCANDQSVRGKPVRAISCGSVENKYPSIQGRYGADDKCLEITTQGRLGGESSLYHIDKLYSTKENKEKIYVISIADNSRPVVPYTYAIKQTEENYLVPMEQTCEQICKGELTGERVQIGLQTTTGGKVELKDKGKVKSKELDIEEDGKNYIMTYGCITPNQCISYTSGETKKINVEGEEKDVDVKTAIPMGYTSDCFAPEYVSGDSNKRIECCCINSQGGAINEYFQPGDIENKNGDFSGDYEDMEWSYRYYQLEKKGGYKNKRYNPNRYIEGRDIMACFGQNHILYDGFSEDGDGKLLVIDPMEQHIAAFQCLAISQIRNRLLLLRNMMGALKTCLLQIRTTGEADAGVCKEIFTQYICAFIWKIITWARDGCLPFGKGVDWTGSDNRVLEFVSVGMKGMWDSVADSQQELASEYGNAQLNNLIGLGEEDVFRKVCLAAFGYDWEISLDSLVDASYQSPYATLVQAVLPSREYLTFDPVTYNAKYEYRASWLINPGCDLEGYKVELACVTRNDMYNHPGINCAKQADPYGKNCDCLDLKPEDAPSTLMYYHSTRGIGQNELQAIDSTQISGRIKNSPYRYD
ncbi:fibronectin type III domain-containing protein, partial [Candidatus Woesearchaeota archaeon]|nr:fibronectin type III domain-containing protein [Candidatus Woesearchaeota archaeon]